MPVAVEKTGDVTIACPQGRLDSMNAATVEKELVGLVDGGSTKVVIDMVGLDYISSAGLRLILVVAKKLKPLGGSLVLCGMQPHIREVFEISGFLSILTVTADRDAALQKVGG